MRLHELHLKAFYTPNKDKPNFNVFCDALVHKLILEKSGDEYVAKGIEFGHRGSVYEVYAKQEVVLCAG